MQVEVGKIDLMKTFTFVEVASEQAKDVIKSMKHGVTVKGRSVVCDIADKTEQDKDHRQGKKSIKKNVERGSGYDARGTRGTDDRKTERAKRDKTKRVSKEQVQQHHYTKDDWMKFLHPDTSPFKGEIPNFAEEGWARRKPKKKK
jgi:ATP-dependent RNA helicase DeaD